jgi:hypothetical protein
MNTTKSFEQIDEDLILRYATPADGEALAKFNGEVHADPEEDFAEFIAVWVRELMSGNHPTTKAEDFTLVENVKTGEIVSSLCLIDQTWAYEGIEFPVGRPELVGTKDEFRRRGLVRKQFDLIHEWSEKRGQVMQFITGIPWFYRQFGYEMAVNLGGRRQGFLEHIPKLKDDEKEPYRFRSVEEKDLPFITKLYRKSCQRNLLSCVRNEKSWHYEAFMRNLKSDFALRIEIIETTKGKSVGYLMTHPTLFGSRLPVVAFEVIEGISWFEAAHPTLRRIKEIGQEIAARDTKEEKKVEFTSFSFSFGAEHPVYDVIPTRMPRVFDPYAFYIRLPDVESFLQLITPVLEERLDGSYMAGHNGELLLNFFTNGIKIDFERGKIKNIESWEKPDYEKASANFPNLTFLQLLFGYRDVQELEDAYADIYYPKEEAKPLLKSLFPKKASNVLELA